ncbi:hypothetical protein K9M09_00610 [Patescibacteria group bacterium]|nr:hypothetical protein [Patescibacteria group bacterium]
MKKKLKFSWKRVWQRSLILGIMALAFNIILNNGADFFFIFAWSTLLVMFFIFWLKTASKQKDYSFFSVAIIYTILMAIGLISGAVYSFIFSTSWIWQLSISSLITAIFFVIYFLTVINDTVRVSIKDWIGARMGYPFLMLLAQLIIAITKISLPFSQQKKLRL